MPSAKDSQTLVHNKKTTNTVITGTSESKLDSSILSGEIEIKLYNILRHDRSRKRTCCTEGY